ncbi:hypothetical protein BGZ94_006185 [Podila epigama]|nr:hypothetical protein BGZ94_006185 [Podila epigama]
MKYTTIIAAAAAIATVAAQATEDEGRLWYTEPTSATVWNSGSTATVSWNNVCKSQNTGDLNIVLYIGDGTNNQTIVPGIGPIGTLNCLKSKSAEVKIPANLTTSQYYALHVETKPLQSYSAPFTIKGVDPVPAPGTGAPAPGTGAPAPGTGAPAPGTGAPGTGAPAPGAPSATTTGAVAPPPPVPPPLGEKKDSAAGSLKAVGSTVAIVAAAFGALLL